MKFRHIVEFILLVAVILLAGSFLSREFLLPGIAIQEMNMVIKRYPESNNLLKPKIEELSRAIYERKASKKIALTAQSFSKKVNRYFKMKEELASAKLCTSRLEEDVSQLELNLGIQR
jgi:hypothetical protein